jgi:hypothetical protein
MPEKTGTFVVTAAEEESAVLRSVSDSQVHTLEENPGVSEDTILEATIASKPPMDVVWTVESIEATRTIDVAVVDEGPTEASRTVAADLDEDSVSVHHGIEDGEVHVLAVPADRIEETVASIRADLETVVRAARLGAGRVEIRKGSGIVAVRYLDRSE